MGPIQLGLETPNPSIPTEEPVVAVGTNQPKVPAEEPSIKKTYVLLTVSLIELNCMPVDFNIDISDAGDPWSSSAGNVFAIHPKWRDISEILAEIGDIMLS